MGDYKTEEQKFLKETRAELHMTQLEFAKHMEIPLSTVQQWECAKRKPTQWILKLIKRVLTLEGKLK